MFTLPNYQLEILEFTDTKHVYTYITGPINIAPWIFFKWWVWNFNTDHRSLCKERLMAEIRRPSVLLITINNLKYLEYIFRVTTTWQLINPLRCSEGSAGCVADAEMWHIAPHYAASCWDHENQRGSNSSSCFWGRLVETSHSTTTRPALWVISENHDTSWFSCFKRLFP